MLSAHVFASHRTSALSDVWVAGQHPVQAGRHSLHDDAASAFVAARSAIISGS
jgi:formimidoylglutamate deiminase